MILLQFNEELAERLDTLIIQIEDNQRSLWHRLGCMKEICMFIPHGPRSLMVDRLAQICAKYDYTKISNPAYFYLFAGDVRQLVTAWREVQNG
jgi:hypothetical protein